MGPHAAHPGGPASASVQHPPTDAPTLSYRAEIRELDRAATPAPWARQGELYGVLTGQAFLPLGFAPHHPLDSRLIAVYRAALMQMITALDAVERLAQRALAEPSAPSAIGVTLALAILDASGGDGVPLRHSVVELDRATTQPLWDPGHLVLGMELDPSLRSLGIATPRAGDAPLIAVARIAVPRAVAVLTRAEESAREHGWRDGRLAREGALAIQEAVTAFDRHQASEGRGTGTV